MNEPLVSIIIRSFNEAWALRGTLAALPAQDYRDWELVVIDSGSTDGSVEMIRAAKPQQFVQIAPGDYQPGRVMNQAMRLTRADYGIFVNADATPQGTGWLRPLVHELQRPQVAAVFGRQVPRPDCQAVFAQDYERCFGPRRDSVKWGHFFSMASSGIRRDIWARRGFDETLRYSEDDEYTRWCRAQGYEVCYCPESVAMHSHNYTPAQAYQRAFGEAKTAAALWEGSPAEVTWLRTTAGGWLNDLRRDLGFCLRTGRLRDLLPGARIRWAQRCGRLDGFRAGWREYRQHPRRPVTATCHPTLV